MPKTETTLDERIRLVCELRGFNEAEWLARARKSHSLFSSFRTRLGSNPNTSIAHDNLEALARVAGVHLRWLKRGEGPRDTDVGGSYDARPAESTAPSGVAEEVAHYERSGFTINLRVEAGRLPELRFGNLIEWPALLSAGRAARPDYRDGLWKQVAETPLFLPEPPSAEMLVFVADRLARSMPQGTSPS